MKQMFVFLLVMSLLLGACSRPEAVKKPAERIIPENCPDAIIDYVSAVHWNDIHYEMNYESATDGLERGEKIGEVEFKLDGVACLDYKMQHGDATYEEIGTPIYLVKGYGEHFRLFVGDKLYEASINKQAKTVGDVFDIEGQVEKVSFLSSYDASHLFDFTKEASQQFVEEFLKLKYIGYTGAGTETNGTQYFLRIHLQDGSSVQICYWIDSNFLLPGARDNDLIKRIVREQINKGKKTT